METFYDLLGVPPDATGKRIRERFDELRLAGGLEPGSETYQRLVKIVDFLMDPGRRDVYDRKIGVAEPSGAPGLSTPETPPVDEVLAAGKTFLDREQWEEAARALGKAADLRGDHAEARALHGFALYRSGRVEAALAEYRVALSQDANCPPAHRGLGVYFADQDRDDDAFRELQDALAADPQDIEALLALAALAGKRGNTEREKELLDSAKRLRPSHAAPYRRLGELLFGTGLYAEAAREFARVLELRPGDADAAEHLGSVNAELEAWDDAEACFKRALQAKPEHPGALLGLGRLFVRLDRDGAGAVLERFVRVAPDHPDGQWLLGWHLSKIGEYDRAEPLLSRATQIDSRHRWAHAHLGELLLHRCRAAEAARHFEVHLEIEPESTKVRLLLGDALLEVERLAEAEAAYRAVLAADPGNPAAFSGLGHVLMRRGDHDAAVKVLMAALEAAPEVPDTLFRLAQAFAACGRHREAAARYRRGLDLVPGDREAQFGLASVLMASGQWDEAIGILERRCQAEPDDARAHADLGKALMGKGVPVRAAELLERAIDLAPEWAAPYHWLTDLHEKLAAWDDARLVMSRYAAAFPEDPAAYFRIGRSYRSQGFDSEAGAAFRKYLRMAPDGPHAAEIAAWLR